MSATDLIPAFPGDKGDASVIEHQVSAAATATAAVPPKSRPLHDPSVSLEEYMYYAERTRAEEDLDPAPRLTLTDVLLPSLRGGAKVRVEMADINLNDQGKRAAISDEEWRDASRALRSATAAACFYLITTDILGPFGVGFALGTMGWGEGIGLFTLFGFCAGVSGYLIWKVYMLVDSYEFPARNYGDLGFRLYGRWLQHTTNIFQAFQMILVVGIITISNGLSISQVSQFRLCYIVGCLIWVILGFGLGQIQTLNSFGWLANVAVFLNLLIMFISMGVMAHSDPNFAGALLSSAGTALGGDSVMPLPDESYPPVQTFGGVPPSSNGFVGSINGLMQCVFAYAGAQLFVEFMAEMRRPRDFLKVMWAAQGFIYACYMIYGSYVYYWQGQYSNQIAYQGLSPYTWQTVCNMIAVLSGMIAATLLGNIGIKVIYNNLLVDLFSAPPLNTRSGKLLWATIVPFYWTLAFVIASSIPAVFQLTALTSALCFVQFTYTFPALLGLGLFVQRGAIVSEPPFDPTSGRVFRKDWGVRRAIRGFCGKYVVINVALAIYALGSLVVSGLGSYAAIEALIAAFQSPQVNSFTCRSPLQGS